MEERPQILENYIALCVLSYSNRPTIRRLFHQVFSSAGSGNISFPLFDVVEQM